MPSTPNASREDVVILVHGIRDYALWQNAIRMTLEHAGFKVEPTNYGRYSVFRFLVPVRCSRTSATNEIWEQIRIVRQTHPDARLSIIAHSFGTYIVASLLKRNFDLNAHRVIFCGSIVSYRFPFQDVQGRFTPPILNDVGTADIWPAIAQSVTWGYGSSGTFGFRRPLVHDRWHNGAGHGYFLSSEFCSKFWIPFLKDGVVVEAAGNPESPPLWVRLISIFKVKYIILLMIVGTLGYFKPGFHLVYDVAQHLFGRAEIKEWQTWPWPKKGTVCLDEHEKLAMFTCGPSDQDFVVTDIGWNDNDHGLNVREAPGVIKTIDHKSVRAKAVFLLPPNAIGLIRLNECIKGNDGGDWCHVECNSRIGWVSQKYVKRRTEQLQQVKTQEFNMAETVPIRNGPNDECTQTGSLPYDGMDVIVHSCEEDPKVKSVSWCLVTYQSASQSSSGWVPERYLTHKLSSGRAPER